MGFLLSSPLGIAVAAITAVVVAAVVFVGANVILAFSGGPDPCTPGGGPITVDASNASSFQQKWDGFDAILDGGTPSAVALTESGVTSRADQYITQDTNVGFKDIRVCIHDGYGEATGSLSILGLESKVRVEGSVDLTGDHPVAEINDIEMGSVPGFIMGAVEGLVEDAVEEVLQDIDLKHTYTPTLSEGQAQIDGQP